MEAIKGVGFGCAPPQYEGLDLAPPEKFFNLATNISKILHIFYQIYVLKKSFSLQ